MSGWVDTRRDHGKIVFLDLRDKSGKLQIVLVPGTKAYEAVQEVKAEWVISLTGVVKKRPEKLINKNLLTGKVELEAEELLVLSPAKSTPFEINKDSVAVDEELRLKYRYLDLRTERMARNLTARHEMVRFIRQYLWKEGFREVETPILTKTTPEGARDFLVPSRLQLGKFYALPQSPQQYKQMLMVAGVEKYFQIAKCFRDEDARADRAYGEFTQLDLEMSFVEQEDILQLTERMFTKMVEKLWPDKKISKKPWPRLTHKEAMAKYGTDKPDLRKDKNNPNELAFTWVLDFPLFAKQNKEDYFYGVGKASKWAPSHHMFTAPHPDDISLLEQDPGRARGLQHDLAVNGYEVGGGSIRIHQAEIQSKIFELIGFSKEQVGEFAHMLEAFTYGVPPHGGIAPGIDRMLAVIQGEKSLREVMAFPMSTSGIAAVGEAPSQAATEQLKEVGICLNKKEEKKVKSFRAGRGNKGKVKI